MPHPSQSPAQVQQAQSPAENNQPKDRVVQYLLMTLISTVGSSDSYGFKVLESLNHTIRNEFLNGVKFSDCFKVLKNTEKLLNHCSQNMKSFAAYKLMCKWHHSYDINAEPGARKNVLTSICHCLRHPLMRSCPLTSSIDENEMGVMKSLGDNLVSALFTGLSLIAPQAFLAIQR